MAKKRRTFSIEFKYQVVIYARENSLRKTALKFKIDRKTLRNWMVKADKFKDVKEKRNRSYIRTKNIAAYPELDKDDDETSTDDGEETCEEAKDDIDDEIKDEAKDEIDDDNDDIDDDADDDHDEIDDDADDEIEDEAKDEIDDEVNDDNSKKAKVVSQAANYISSSNQVPQNASQVSRKRSFSYRYNTRACKRSREA